MRAEPDREPVSKRRWCRAGGVGGLGAAYTLYTRTYIKAVSGTYTLASSVAPPFSPLSVSLSKLACLGTLSLPTLIAVAVSRGSRLALASGAALASFAEAVVRGADGDARTEAAAQVRALTA